MVSSPTLSIRRTQRGSLTASIAYFSSKLTSHVLTSKIPLVPCIFVFNGSIRRALYPTFMTPWSDAKQVAAHTVEPDFTLPACYHVQPQAVQGKLPHFHEETLFFIFYSQPRDLMQELAALEL